MDNYYYLDNYINKKNIENYDDQELINEVFNEDNELINEVLEGFTDTLKGDKGKQGQQGFKGVPGDVGLRGLGGAIGPQGLKGAKGVQGIRGNVGDIGDPGKAGKPGDIGVKGVKGVRGPTGDKGPRGPRGPRGLTGPTGKKGPKGPDGPKGPIGDSGFQFSRFSIDNPGSCEWIKINHGDNLKAGQCPGNKAMNGIRSSRRISKVQIEVENCCKRKCKWIFWCKTKCKWCVNHPLTTYQYNRQYDICCVDMPFSSDPPSNLSDNEIYNKYKNKYSGKLLKEDYKGNGVIKAIYDAVNAVNAATNRANIIEYGKLQEKYASNSAGGPAVLKEGSERLDPNWGVVRNGPLISNDDLLDSNKTTLNKYPFHLPN